MLYCYTTADGHTTDHVFDIGQAPMSITLPDGQTAFRDIAAEHPASGPRCAVGSKWPIYSDAAGVHPDQIPEAMAYCESVGVPTSYTKDGRAILVSRSHRAKHLKAVGLYDRDAGYGDYAGDH